MLSQSLAVLVAAATVSLAKTPSGFEPGSDTDLIVGFSNVAALNGAMISKEGSSPYDILASFILTNPGRFSERQ